MFCLVIRITIYEVFCSAFHTRRRWELDLLIFKKRRLREYLIAVYSYLMRESRKDRHRCFSVAGWKAADQSRIQNILIRYKDLFFLPMRTITPREFVDSPYLWMFRTWLNLVLLTLLWVGGWMKWPSVVLSNTNYSMVLLCAVFGVSRQHIWTLSRLSFANPLPILLSIYRHVGTS